MRGCHDVELLFFSRDGETCLSYGFMDEAKYTAILEESLLEIRMEARPQEVSDPKHSVRAANEYFNAMYVHVWPVKVRIYIQLRISRSVKVEKVCTKNL